MSNEKTLTDMTCIDCIDVNGKVYISLNEVFAIIEGYQRYRPDSIETTSYIRGAIKHANETGRTLDFRLHDSNGSGDTRVKGDERR